MSELVNIVRVVSTTTGTGTLTLGSAVSGFLTMAQSGAADGAIYSYAIEADYVAGIPTSREVGTGTYTASGTTLTRSVINSTNSNAALNLAGDAQVFVTPNNADIRNVLTAALNLYVRTDGSDSNTGLANTAGAAFLTLQHAYDTICSNYDLGGQSLTVNVAAGTYTGGLNLSQPWTGGGSVSYLGDTTTPANVLLNVTGNNCVAINTPLPGTFGIGGFKFQTTTSGRAIDHAGGGTVNVNGKCDFGACVSEHMFVESPAAMFVISTAYNITGAATAHLNCQSGRLQQIGSYTNVVTGVLNFSNAFCAANLTGLVYISSGAGVSYNIAGATVTGNRYTVDSNGVARVDGGGANFFPGNVAGTTATGGQYV